MDLSIIIVTWNGDELLRNCLESLRRVYDERPEVIVVDNANMPSTAAIVGGYPNAKYVAASENLGFAGGNNLALPQVTRKNILLLNNDTIIHGDSFSPLLDFLIAHPKVGIVQGTMNVPAMNNGLDDCGVLMRPWGLQKHLHHGEPTATTKLVPRKVFAAKGAMLMFKRAVLEDTGFLFYDHFKSYYEETDFCHRARLKGWETWFVPTPPIDHLGGQTSGKFDRMEIMSQYFRNILFSFHHNYGFWGHVFTIPCFVCAAFVYSPKALLKALRLTLFVAVSAFLSLSVFGGMTESQQRVTAWEFVDQTDAHCELVQKSEWMLMSGDAPFSIDANVLDCQDVIAQTGVVYVVEGPVSTSRWKDNPDFTVSGRSIVIHSNGFVVASLPYSGGDFGRILALRAHSRRHHPYSHRRDGLMLSNTWGDRHRFERINEQDMLRELDAASAIGVDVMQIDAGWALANDLPNVQPSFGASEWERYWNPPEGSWNVNTNRFPNGLRPLATAAVEKGMSLGLWYAPNCADDASAWQSEAQNLLRLWREQGVRFFKTDFMSMYSQRGFDNERKLFDAVIDGSHGAIAIDLDITGKVPRLGYFGAPRCGIFVENRYIRPNDGRLYYPHRTLRALWTLSETIDPIRLRMEFMNPKRLPESYGDSPLAPSKWPADSLMATVLAASPLAWMDCVDVAPETRDVWRALIDIWKRERKAWYGGAIVPIGSCPDGIAWTGFASVPANGKGGYVLIFRELSSDARQVFDLRSFFGHVTSETMVIAGRGSALLRDGRLMVSIPNQLDFLWVRW